MRKIVFMLFIIIITYVFIGNIVAKNNLIPDGAIRVRVIANSNSDYDQNIKFKVKEQIQADMYNMLKNAKNIDEAREIISGNLDELESNIDSILRKQEYNKNFEINFGLNYFPEKEFKGIKYNEGYYESVVVTLGDGLGDNWWCVLFPPLCLLEAEESELSDVEYTTLAKTIIDKYF